MKIRLKADISGNRNGVAWPSRGSVVDLPDDEALQMLRNGMGETVKSSGSDIETAMVADDSTKRGLTTSSAAGVVPHQQDSAGALIPNKDTPAAAGPAGGDDRDAQSGDGPGDAGSGDSSESDSPAADSGSTPAASTPRKASPKKTAATKPATGK